MALIVTQKRTDWAAKTIRETVATLDEAIILELADEIGLAECLSYNETMTGFDFDFTDLQMIAFAAAAFAVAEIRNA